MWNDCNDDSKSLVEHREDMKADLERRIIKEFFSAARRATLSECEPNKLVAAGTHLSRFVLPSIVQRNATSRDVSLELRRLVECARRRRTQLQAYELEQLVWSVGARLLRMRTRNWNASVNVVVSNGSKNNKNDDDVVGSLLAAESKANDEPFVNEVCTLFESTLIEHDAQRTKEGLASWRVACEGKLFDTLSRVVDRWLDDERLARSTLDRGTATAWHGGSQRLTPFVAQCQVLESLDEQFTAIVSPTSDVNIDMLRILCTEALERGSLLLWCCLITTF